MSYFASNDGFTEDEIKMGLPGILETDWYEEESDEFTTESHSVQPGIAIKRFNENKFRLFKIIGGITNKKEIKEAIAKHLINQELESLIKRYCIVEKLPKEFVNIAKQDNGLSILIKGYLRKYGKVSINLEVENEVFSLIKFSYSNPKSLNIYDRVGYIQLFIHNKVQYENGLNYHLLLDKEITKNLLSAARLHLNLMDIKRYDVRSLVRMNDINKSLIKKEKYKVHNNEALWSPLLRESKYVPLWKVNHMGQFYEDLPNSIKEKIESLIELDETMSNEDFIHEAVKQYIEVERKDDVKESNKNEGFDYRIV